MADAKPPACSATRHRAESGTHQRARERRPDWRDRGVPYAGSRNRGELSRESGAVVSRTALRVRNPANAPDDLQRAILEQFADDLAAGRTEMPLEAAVEINRGGKIEHRYMRAIPMDAMCLACHGQQLAPEVASAIAKAYPADQATGFEQGQLRGAFSVIWPATPPAPNR